MYDVLLPRALIWGCSYELFWTLNPRKLEAFQKAYSEREKDKATAVDILAWRIGRYVVNSVATGLDGRKNKYPDKPDLLRPSPEVEEANRIRDYMMKFAIAGRERRRKKNEVNKDV